MSVQQTVDLLKMYNKPEIWPENAIYVEVETALDKLSPEAQQLNDRERFILSQLTRGLLDIVETTLTNTSNEEEKATLLGTATGILQFIHYLDN